MVKISHQMFPCFEGSTIFDEFISLLKRVFKSNLAARVSEFNRLHFLLVLSFLYQYPFAPSIESATLSSYNSLSSSARSLKNLLIFIFAFSIQLFWLLSRAD